MSTQQQARVALREAVKRFKKLPKWEQEWYVEQNRKKSRNTTSVLKRER